MLENKGHWLKLMRTANLPTEANICLRISGEDIVCTVTKDVNKEDELKVTCHIADKENAQEFEHSELSPENQSHQPSNPQTDITDEEKNNSQCSNPSSNSLEEMLDFASERLESSEEEMHTRVSVTQSDCESMEVEKSRNENTDSDCENSEIHEGSSSRLLVSPSVDDKAIERKSPIHKRGTQHSEDTNPGVSTEQLDPPEKTPKLSQPKNESLHKCHRCNFTTGDQHALEKHVHSHRNPPGKRASSKMTNAMSYCDACRIQFMSIDTFHVHKQLYCKSRHDKDEDPSSPLPLPVESIHPSVGFKPGPDTVIIRGGLNGGVTPSLIQPQAIYAAISTNPLILLPCSLVNGQSLVPQGSVLPTGAPSIVLQTGIACPTIVEKPSVASKLKDESLPSRKTSHPIMHFSGDKVDRPSNSSISLLRKRKMSEGDVLNLKKSCTSTPARALELEVAQKETEPSSMTQDAPLDLSVKKFPDPSCRSPARRKDSVISPGCQSPTPQSASDSGSPQRSSVVHSRVTSSPANSFSNDSVHCYAPKIPVVLARQSSIDRVSPLPPVLHADTSLDKQVPHASMPPPKLVKQGNNVCEECNIVFYKYDNYLAHKRHYCAYRRQQLSALAAAAASNQEQSSDDNNSNHSGYHESGSSSQPYQTEDSNKSGSRRDQTVEHFRSVITKTSSSVYCCDACGVKFSTSDNLEAHQTYYCIKKADSAMSKKAAMRGENSSSPKSLELPFDGPEEWKCNYCDATCSSYDTIRRHLSTHSELKGYRCIVCGYKGNTMRGMRTHACEHLTEGSISIEEFILTKVISESGSIAPIIPNHSEDESDNSKDIRSIYHGEETDSSDRGSLRRNTHSSDHSESNELSNSPRLIEKSSRDHVPNSTSPLKMESTSCSSPDTHASSPRDPSAFCDVVIKTEHSSEEESSAIEDLSKTGIKYEPESQSDDSDDKPQDLSKSPPRQTTSVIRRASDIDSFHRNLPSAKRKSKLPMKNNELKYCKVCEISFSHLSNYLAHKKFYCVSRVIQNCMQEAATVQ